jgi:hypothetical protein
MTVIPEEDTSRATTACDTHVYRTVYEKVKDVYGDYVYDNDGKIQTRIVYDKVRDENGRYLFDDKGEILLKPRVEDLHDYVCRFRG